MSQLKKNILRVSAALSTLVASASAFAQTASTTVTSAPGAPTTALGGEWVSNAILLLAGLAIVILGVVVYRKKSIA